MVLKNVQKVIFAKFVARNTTLVLVRKGINTRLIKVQIQLI